MIISTEDQWIVKDVLIFNNVAFIPSELDVE